MGDWQEWRESPWGRLRYSLAEANLARHLPAGPLKILDLAGGDGGDAVRLAARGHDVTVVDRSTDMITKARASGLTCVTADVHDLPAGLGGFDVVLCHNLLQYVPDPAHTLNIAKELLVRDGLLSVIVLNQHAAPLTTAIRKLDLTAALAALDTNKARTELFDTDITLFTAEKIIGLLDDCELVGHYGIRSVSDYIVDDDRKRDPEFFAELERLELAVTDRVPYKHIARMCQLIGRKR
ncbi:class I SAM-dependent methyltransferase [Kibdelosporangium philippinense]|uniref:Class I SAM-dependent methyltransferase n=1 Tax=Kibdelosporangium philippinense TaxID=211113 RepID=A0ABS8ZPZ2_9PSEU|nr:class I SAM-dependent methyltransferase [Kibdelosporangium philippinense]MCE7009816.1 class I SAM-dependent methyltransferase [Kibdelosporangium philippinense]